MVCYEREKQDVGEGIEKSKKTGDPERILHYGKETACDGLIKRGIAYGLEEAEEKD